MTPRAQVEADAMFGLISHTDATTARARVDINDLRSVTLATIVRLAERHNLPVPIGVDGRNSAGILSLWLRFDSDAALDGWARILGLRAYDFDTWREANAIGLGAAVWLGWYQVHATAYACDRIPNPAQVATAVLAPDAEVSA